VAQFPALKQRLRDHGAELIEPRRETPFERFFFRDPNGSVFEVVSV
jgi:catechol 2,3-dioxygenase-like lactoylglutathione lyase family enzyme